MPRVSDAHLAARRQQILEAAWRCFTRQGFHATSMQDVFAESGLSAGAVYRYFPSKADLVRITAEGIAGIADDIFQELIESEPFPWPDEALRRTITYLSGQVGSGDTDRTKIALHVWSEAVRDQEINEVVTTIADRLVARWTQLADRWRELGYVPADTDSAKTARMLYGAMIGFVVQRHLFGVQAEDYADGFSALTARPPSVAEIAGGHP